MSSRKPRITAKIAGRPLHPLLRPFAVGYFLAALPADLVYSQASIFVRHSAPEFAAITEWLLDRGPGHGRAGRGRGRSSTFWASGSFRALPDLRMYAAGSALVMALEIYNFHLRHSIGADAITPTGLILSLAAIARPAGHAVAGLGPDVSLSATTQPSPYRWGRVAAGDWLASAFEAMMLSRGGSRP